MTCAKSLKNGNIPKAALVNHLWVGKMPDMLRCLNRVELSMLALVNPITAVTMLPEARGQTWHSVKGKNKVFSVVNDVSALVSKLPRMPSRDSIAIFVNKNCTTPDELDFHPRRVTDAFDWLQKHNHLYANIEFDSAFRALGDEPQHPPVIEMEEDESVEMNTLRRAAREAADSGSTLYLLMISFRFLRSTAPRAAMKRVHQLHVFSLRYTRWRGRDFARHWTRTVIFF
jgi:hypothetical protein